MLGYDLSEYNEMSLRSRALGSRISGLNVRLKNLVKGRSVDLRKKFKMLEDRDDLM